MLFYSVLKLSKHSDTLFESNVILDNSKLVIVIIYTYWERIDNMSNVAAIAGMLAYRQTLKNKQSVAEKSNKTTDTKNKTNVEKHKCV